MYGVFFLNIFDFFVKTLDKSVKMCGRFVDVINKATLAVKGMYPTPKLQGGRTMKLKIAKILLQ